MYSNIYKILIISLMSLLMSSCVKEDFVQPEVSGEMVWVDFSFGHNNYEEIKITTKATLDIVPESRINNLFVYVFVGGKRYYAHYFDGASLKATEAEVKSANENCWFVDQKTSPIDAPTRGTVRIKAPILTGGKMYVMANINSDMVNISPEKLNMVTTESQLVQMQAVLNQEITSRNGFFPMAGMETVNISSTGITNAAATGGSCKVMLDRMDAKIRFNVRVASGYETQDQTGTTVTTQHLKEFRPVSWRVVNLPKGMNVVPGQADAELGFFSTPQVSFETTASQNFSFVNQNGVSQTVTSDVHGFSFYMLENRETPKKNVMTYHDRDLRNKDPQTGKFDNTDGMWANAPENATYVEIKGEVIMDVDVSSDAKTQELAADVTYYVHLGDFKKSVNDYNVLHNTFYDYTITIKGVKNIELEVVSSKPGYQGGFQEKEPGAEGNVYIAKESVYTFDSHYGQRVFCFDAEFIDPDNVTWYVKTPFGKEGTPDIVAGTEVPSGMDYKWVHFLVNDYSTSKNYTTANSTATYTLPDFPYSQNNMTWPGHPADGYKSNAEKALEAKGKKVMDIVEFTKYIKAQAVARKEGRPNDFRREFDQSWLDWWNQNHPTAQVTNPDSNPQGRWFRDRIYVTIYVDEFYYEEDPISGEVSPTLWKRFVNQPNRLMHILCDNEKSLDGASSTTGSVITIRQNSIQTPYSLRGSCQTAWGGETDDENADSYFFFYPSETNMSQPQSLSDYGNSSDHNGLFNTVKLLQWQDGVTRWDTFLDYNRPNDYKSTSTKFNGREIGFLKEDKACYQYSFMTRNRDNNGNGVIDQDEIRWYTAALVQLEYLFMGELGLSEEAVTYPRRLASQRGNYPAGHPYAGSEKWKLHIISSTASDQRKPRLLWAEEGLSVSRYKEDGGWERGPYAVKCLRNLGFPPSNYDIHNEAHRPEPLIKFHKMGTGAITQDTEFRFDVTNVNARSKRFYSSVDLEPYDENSEMARLFEGFMTGPVVDARAKGINNYADLKNMISSGKSPCPAGYRVPNFREAGVMFLLCKDSIWWPGWIYTGTFYSMGEYGSRVYAGATSWAINATGNINLSTGPSHIRCVKDWDPIAYPIK